MNLRKLLQIFKRSFKEFCLNTSLHGYKYIVNDKKHTRNKFERLFWFVLVLSSHIAALIISLIAYNSYKEIATITVTDSTHYPIWNYQFPAVTVCSINKISKRKAFDLAEILRKPSDLTTEELAIQFRLLIQLINQNDDRQLEKNLTRLQDILDSNDLEPHDVLRRLSYGCEELQRCLWKSEEKRCESLVEELTTIDGHCCAFNYFGKRNHTFEGLNANKAARTPRRVAACGFTSALEFLIHNNVDDYFGLDMPMSGHKIYIHHPYEKPDSSVPFILLPNQFIVFISITPSITYSSQHVRSLDVDIRKCLHYDEKELISYKYYTYHNCMTECRMNLTKLYCSCIPFYYVNKNVPYFDKVRICNLKDVLCMKHVKNIIIRSTSRTPRVIDNDKNHIEDNFCKCLPTCEFTFYPYEGSSGSILKNFVNSDINLYYGINITNQSGYRVFYSDLTASRNRCDIYYNWDVLLALFGGILGLFVGFSFISAFELIYYFTIRPSITFILQLRRKQFVIK